ncbi:hypothetical protein FKW77_006349 [Venturia effusa]|uniref:G domain-containing protein n=1 Tax=Venturia effusa TaxID=50376 RepID=A0A517L3F9_9PEZI|nr:hypothetical protein FKW77_006349 [Venturia effusa]
MDSHVLEELGIEGSEAPMILLLGQTGAGKSHFINSLKPGSVKESAHSVSCTSCPELVEVEVDGKSFLLIDTPGFNDTWRDFKRSDSVILEEIARTLAIQRHLGVKLRGILYLYDIMSTRMTGDTLRQAELVRKVCGAQNFCNVMLVTTRWPDGVEAQRKWHCPIREGDLRRMFWRQMIEGGSRMWRFDDTMESAKAIIRIFEEKDDVVLALQQEMMHGTTLENTSAGSWVIEERRNDEERLAVFLGEGNRVEAEDLSQSIQQRVTDEPILKEDVAAKVQADIKAATNELKRESRKRTIANVITWLFQIGSITASVVTAVLQ